MATSRDEWRSGFGTGTDANMELAKQVINEAYENAKYFVDWAVASQEDNQGESTLPREIGGLDKSAQELGGLLGIAYERRYHNDGCAIDHANDPENGSDESDGSSGHDYTAGCELADEEGE